MMIMLVIIIIIIIIIITIITIITITIIIIIIYFWCSTLVKSQCSYKVVINVGSSETFAIISYNVKIKQELD